jgi:hypothetical protein
MEFKPDNAYATELCNRKAFPFPILQGDMLSFKKKNTP